MTEHRSNPRHRRRKSGVPVMLTIVLIIISLLMGAMAGYVIARKTDTHVHALQAANDRVTELLKELVKNNPGSNEQRLYIKACMRAKQEIVDGKLKLD